MVDYKKNFDRYLDNLEAKYDDNATKNQVSGEPDPETNHPQEDQSQNNVSKVVPASGQQLKAKRPPGKINNHYIAAKPKGGLNGIVRDHGKITLEVFERNLAKRKGLVPEKKKGDKDFITMNLVPKQKLKINRGRGSKDVGVDY